ncbi:Reverse transcriptase (RNA-dependent DNA polymerase) [Polaribacter sp. Hel1_33_78]|uniref:RNA-directed DNA polymerase n=1 Tax=Polaribacter sp. Hel1_33_78 TaxID=1336804 RepID=UPI00087D796F|nr:RNA-directed DNA polymerase [Polaribacter sp. Hel1_33_78]SDU12314.1 Reverse transcriptase (RNA-dependent DNA polymerase) [Polaribacter sp. Hel1_33_78]
MIKGIGIDKDVLDKFDYELAIKRIKRDINSDFIFAPHYSIIFEKASKELFEQLKTKLLSGNYSTRLPISMNVIKQNGFSRNGSILEPIDRLAYQLVVDYIGKKAENEIDRTQVFSNVLLNEDIDGKMFERSGDSYDKFKNRIQELSKSGKYTHVLKSDISSYFDKIYQHNIGNLLYSSGADSKAVSFLERFMLLLRENDSHGIVQGVFPSDLLGNFALCDIDAQHSLEGLEFSRYVDDIYIFFDSLNNAKIHKVRLGNWLRKDGLTLNESKTRIFEVNELQHEESELDKLFENAKSEIIDRTIEIDVNYGLDSLIWDLETNTTYEEKYDEEDLKLEATKKLFNSRKEFSNKFKIEKYCLSIFTTVNCDYAIEQVLKNFADEPSLAQTYFGYLRKMIVSNRITHSDIESLLKKPNLIFDYQKKWVYSLILYLDNVNPEILNIAMKDLKSNEKNISLRALCAIIIGKHGTSAFRRILKTHYQSENSEYVKSAILYASQYFSTQNRDTCYKAWSGHSDINTLIVRALKKK